MKKKNIFIGFVFLAFIFSLSFLFINKTKAETIKIDNNIYYIAKKHKTFTINDNKDILKIAIEIDDIVGPDTETIDDIEEYKEYIKKIIKLNYGFNLVLNHNNINYNLKEGDYIVNNHKLYILLNVDTRLFKNSNNIYTFNINQDNNLTDFSNLEKQKEKIIINYLIEPYFRTLYFSAINESADEYDIYYDIENFFNINLSDKVDSDSLISKLKEKKNKTNKFFIISLNLLKDKVKTETIIESLDEIIKDINENKYLNNHEIYYIDRILNVIENIKINQNNNIEQVKNDILFLINLFINGYFDEEENITEFINLKEQIKNSNTYENLFLNINKFKDYLEEYNNYYDIDTKTLSYDYSFITNLQNEINTTKETLRTKEQENNNLNVELTITKKELLDLKASLTLNEKDKPKKEENKQDKYMQYVPYIVFGIIGVILTVLIIKIILAMIRKPRRF